MAEAMRLMVAVLAAGASRRFGDADKLCAIVRDKPLALHVSDMLSRLDADHHVVIAADENHPCAKGWQSAGFSVVRNPNADEGMGTSVAVAARLARRTQADILLIALADMPLVPLAHYAALVDAGQEMGASAIVASSDGASRMPPAVFGSAHFDALAELGGDQGARDLLQQGEPIACPPEWLTDIDTPEALAALG
ncbi:NTP transferase domain-containing protein [Erythrobacter sp. JK5]|uniref:nucleotidyltransferase family protein n=1 Tax=Erythrobacter sp. JK5 TaxID=2829500 RepID=UPI001BAB77AC|nr:nucleotidyltransferase family protein [Erythrobacter sp. JK5]QUL37999.1 nucleotidyltransferase family protein [Erythrobacter sp. JK5]